MNYVDKTFRDMIKSCISYGRKNESVWNKYPMITKVFEELEAEDEQLDEAIIAQTESDTGGHIADKHSRTAGLGKRSYRLNRKLSLLAKDTNNVSLLKTLDTSETAFVRDTNEKMFSLFRLTVKLGRDYLAQGAEYGITLRELDSIDAEIDAVEKLPSQINVLTNDHKAATTSITRIIVSLRATIGKLDDAFEGLIDDDDYVDEWFSVRRIKGRHHGKKSTDTSSPDTLE